jgi:putative copper export protein
VPSTTDLAIGVLRWVEYAGLIYVIGVFVVRRLASNAPRIAWARPPMERALAVALVGGLAVVVAEALVAGHSLSGAVAFLFGDTPGWVRVARVAAEGGALTLCVLGRRMVAPLALFAAASLAFAGHAAAQQQPAGPIFADALHVLSAGVWAGGVLALAALKPPGGWNGEESRVLLFRFGRVALIAFAITAMTGLLAAVSALSFVSDLWTTPYGVVLSAKSAGVLVMVVLSTLAWRRGFGFIRFEAAVAILVLGATAVLVATPIPPIRVDGVTPVSNVNSQLRP